MIINNINKFDLNNLRDMNIPGNHYLIPSPYLYPFIKNKYKKIFFENIIFTYSGYSKKSNSQFVFTQVPFFSIISTFSTDIRFDYCESFSISSIGTLRFLPLIKLPQNMISFLKMCIQKFFHKIGKKSNF